MEPVAIAVKMGFGEIGIEGNIERFGELLSLLPGGRFDSEALYVHSKGRMAEKGMGELVEQKKVATRLLRANNDGFWRAICEFFAVAVGKLGKMGDNGGERGVNGGSGHRDSIRR